MRSGRFTERLHRVAVLLFGAFAVGDALAAPRIEPVPEASRDAQQQAIAERFASSGMTNAVATYLVHPVLAEALLPYAQYVSNDSTLPPRHRALLLLRTAWLTRSSYLWAHQARRALRNGLTRADLERIAHGPTAEGWSAFEAALLRAADELHVDSFVSDATWAAMMREYDTNQLVDLVYGVGDLTMHAGVLNTLGVALEDDVDERLPSGIPYMIAAEWTNQRLQGKEPRIAPLQPHEWTAEVRARLDPRGTGRSANVFATFARNPPVDALRNAVPGHIRGGSTLSPRHRELLLMRIGVLCRSEYEWAAHMRAGKATGMTDADVERIVRGPDEPGDALETALLRATDELYRDDRISDETWSELAARLDTRQLLDVLIAVGGYRAASMAINSAGVQLDENMADFRFPAFLR
jgi:4-carboxymuconolactone decarboxylase